MTPVEPSLLSEEYISSVEAMGSRPELVAALRRGNLRLSGVRRDWSPLVIAVFLAYGLFLVFAPAFI